MKRESLTGSNFQYIQAALPEITSKNIVLEQYRISVSEDKDTVIVSLVDVTAPEIPGAKGNVGKLAAFAVTLDKKSKKILSSQFIR